MMVSLMPLAALVVALLPLYVSAQDIVYDSIHNVTPIIGTWASGSMAVQTGSGFANPSNESFIYPNVSGISYSFSDDGWYEIARYRFTANGSEPNCIVAVMNWVHGKYDLVANGSIIMTPNGDGYQQIQDACAATSNQIVDYNDTELYQSWRIFLDATTGPHLHLFQFDGSPLAPQFQVSTTPNMLPTQQLRNTSSTTTTSTRRKRSNGVEPHAIVGQWTIGAIVAAVAMGVASSML